MTSFAVPSPAMEERLSASAREILSKHKQRHHNRKRHRTPRTCICNLGDACHGMSAAFAVMKDPRGDFVELPPPVREEDDDEGEEDKGRPLARWNQLRSAYLSHLAPQGQRHNDHSDPEPDSDKNDYVALHHFPPRVIDRFFNVSEESNHDEPLPAPTATMTAEDREKLGLSSSASDNDRVRDDHASGKWKADEYFVTPCYSFQLAHQDLKRSMRHHLRKMELAERMKKMQREARRRELESVFQSSKKLRDGMTSSSKDQTTTETAPRQMVTQEDESTKRDGSPEEKGESHHHHVETKYTSPPPEVRMRNGQECDAGQSRSIPAPRQEEKVDPESSDSQKDCPDPEPEMIPSDDDESEQPDFVPVKEPAFSEGGVEVEYQARNLDVGQVESEDDSGNDAPERSESEHLDPPEPQPVPSDDESEQPDFLPATEPVFAETAPALPPPVERVDVEHKARNLDAGQTEKGEPEERDEASGGVIDESQEDTEDEEEASKVVLPQVSPACIVEETQAAVHEQILDGKDVAGTPDEVFYPMASNGRQATHANDDAENISEAELGHPEEPITSLTARSLPQSASVDSGEFEDAEEKGEAIDVTPFSIVKRHQRQRPTRVMELDEDDLENLEDIASASAFPPEPSESAYHGSPNIMRFWAFMFLIAFTNLYYAPRMPGGKELKMIELEVITDSVTFEKDLAADPSEIAPDPDLTNLVQPILTEEKEDTVSKTAAKDSEGGSSWFWRSTPTTEGLVDDDDDGASSREPAEVPLQVLGHDTKDLAPKTKPSWFSRLWSSNEDSSEASHAEHDELALDSTEATKSGPVVGSELGIEVDQEVNDANTESSDHFMEAPSKSDAGKPNLVEEDDQIPDVPKVGESDSDIQVDTGGDPDGEQLVRETDEASADVHAGVLTEDSVENASDEFSMPESKSSWFGRWWQSSSHKSQHHDVQDELPLDSTEGSESDSEVQMQTEGEAPTVAIESKSSWFGHWWLSSSHDSEPPGEHNEQALDSSEPTGPESDSELPKQTDGEAPTMATETKSSWFGRWWPSSSHDSEPFVKHDEQPLDSFVETGPESESEVHMQTEGEAPMVATETKSSWFGRWWLSSSHDAQPRDEQGGQFLDSSELEGNAVAASPDVFSTKTEGAKETPPQEKKGGDISPEDEDSPPVLYVNEENSDDATMDTAPEDVQDARAGDAESQEKDDADELESYVEEAETGAPPCMEANEPITLNDDIGYATEDESSVIETHTAAPTDATKSQPTADLEMNDNVVDDKLASETRDSQWFWQRLLGAATYIFDGATTSGNDTGKLSIEQDEGSGVSPSPAKAWFWQRMLKSSVGNSEIADPSQSQELLIDEVDDTRKDEVDYEENKEVNDEISFDADNLVEDSKRQLDSDDEVLDLDFEIEDKPSSSIPEVTVLDEAMDIDTSKDDTPTSSWEKAVESWTAFAKDSISRIAPSMFPPSPEGGVGDTGSAPEENVDQGSLLGPDAKANISEDTAFSRQLQSSTESAEAEAADQEHTKEQGMHENLNGIMKSWIAYAKAKITGSQHWTESEERAHEHARAQSPPFSQEDALDALPENGSASSLEPEASGTGQSSVFEGEEKPGASPGILPGETPMVASELTADSASIDSTQEESTLPVETGEPDRAEPADLDLEGGKALVDPADEVDILSSDTDSATTTVSEGGYFELGKQWFSSLSGTAKDKLSRVTGILTEESENHPSLVDKTNEAAGDPVGFDSPVESANVGEINLSESDNLGPSDDPTFPKAEAVAEDFVEDNEKEESEGDSEQVADEGMDQKKVGTDHTLSDQDASSDQPEEMMQPVAPTYAPEEVSEDHPHVAKELGAARPTISETLAGIETDSKISEFLKNAIVVWYNSGFALESVLLVGGVYFYRRKPR